MEIIEAKEHPKGGHIVTFQKVIRVEKKGWAGFCENTVTKTVTEEWLRESFGKWFTWTALKKLTNYSPHETAWDEYQIKQKYSPKPLMFKPKAKGNPNRCMFCHSDMSGMAAQCLKCGGAMHLACADENKDKCITPGCQK